MDSSAAQSLELQVLHQHLLEKKLDFQAKFPLVVQEFSAVLHEIESKTNVIITDVDEKNSTSVIQDTITQTKQQFNKKKAERILAVTQEEIETVFNKVQDIINSNAYTLPPDEQLYLEQQISDVVGFTVVTELDERTLPFTWATAVSLPHIKRHPTDTIQDHNQIHEAGLNDKRGISGWSSPLAELSSELVKQEEYTLTIPLLYQDNVPIKDIHWYKNKKVLLINPYQKKMAVARIEVDTVPQHSKYGVGLSPELSRSLEIWKPPAQGQISFFFIDDDEGLISPGIISYEIHV